MDDDKKPYTPADDEAEAIDRAGLEAAWRELQPLKDDDLPMPRKVLACLRAFKAARSATHGAIKVLKKAHPEASYISHFPESTDMVFSAVMGLDLDGPDEIHPSSVLGARLLALFQATRAMEAMSNVYSAFDNDGSVFGACFSDETVMLAESSICGESEDA